MVDNVATKAEYRGKGIAYDVLAVMISSERKNKSFLTVYTNNKIAEHLYSKLGFKYYGKYMMLYPQKQYKCKGEL